MGRASFPKPPNKLTYPRWATISMACSWASTEPQVVMTTSGPSPPVSSRQRATTSSSAEAM